MHGQDRFTTDHIPGTPATIEKRQEALEALYTRFAPEAEYDTVLQRLLSGDTTGYPSASNADFVLVLKLLHWTGDNVDLTRKLLLESGL